MLRKYKFIGTLAFLVSLPALYFYLQKDERTRVVVRVGDEILVLKGWYGSNKWMLPGGGMHKGEQSAEAAVRELEEETGIVAKPDDLQYVSSGGVKDSYGLRYKYHLFTLTLDSKPDSAHHTYEIFDQTWQKPDLLIQDKKGVLKATRITLATWREHQKLVS